MKVGGVVGWSGVVIDPRRQILDTRVYTTPLCLRKDSFMLVPREEDRLFVLDKARAGYDKEGFNSSLVKVLDASGRVFWKQTWAFRSLGSEKP